jgi:hypothetical protein
VPSLAGQDADLRWRSFSARRTSSQGRSCSSGWTGLEFVPNVVTATTETIGSTYLSDGRRPLRAGYEVTSCIVSHPESSVNEFVTRFNRAPNARTAC